MSKVTEVHIFKAGPQTSAQGVERTFTKKDLAQVAESYNQSIHDAPIVIGHEMSDKTPSWGWVKGVKLKGDNLYAEVEFTPQMGGFINDGLYKKVSAPRSTLLNPKSIRPQVKWSLRHVAMLGGQPPAVKGTFKVSRIPKPTSTRSTLLPQLVKLNCLLSKCLMRNLALR